MLCYSKIMNQDHFLGITNQHNQSSSRYELFRSHQNLTVNSLVLCSYINMKEFNNLSLMIKSYIEKTQRLLDRLKDQKDIFFKIKSETSEAKGMIISLFNDEPGIEQYAKYIDSITSLRSVFIRLRSVMKKTIAQDDFQNHIESAKQDLIAGLKNQDPQVENQYILKEKPASNPSNALEFKQSNLSPKLPQKEAIQRQKDKPQPIGKISQIDYEKIQVQIRYLETAVDLEDYEYNDFRLKDCLKKLILQNIQKGVKVSGKVCQIRIMDETTFCKSKDAGNYRFNPFCDAVEIFLMTKDKTDFHKKLKVIGDIKNIQITYKPIGPQDWFKNSIKLTPKSSIQQLAHEVCHKRQEPQFIEGIKTALKQRAAAQTVQDLFSWDKSDYSKLNMMTTYIYEMEELIQQIKCSLQVGKTRNLSKQKQKCLKISNSHKILRYCVYKSSQGHEDIKKISWLNMENLRNAIAIVKNQIFNEELLNQLKDYFSQFALDPDDKHISFSRGLILYGPPGTGKTVLTEALPNIIGFHLIEKGLSAADFMKSLVGESSRMIRDLVNRATVSPYLLCSVGIDQVDGLVPDRKDKDEKNKGEGISMLLSVIGGNKDVNNLVFMTSTNYLKKIDEAIRRRLSGQYQVGRPNPQARQKIILKKLDYLMDKRNLLNHMINITTNFTGAAISSLTDLLLKSLKEKQMGKRPRELTIMEIDQYAIQIARQFSIKLGVYTLPEIYGNKQDKKFMFSASFLQKISNHFMLVKRVAENEFAIMYATETHRYSQAEGKVKTFYEREEDKVNISTQGNQFESFVNYIKSIFKLGKYKHSVIRDNGHLNYQSYTKEVSNIIAPKIQPRQQQQSQQQYAKRRKSFQQMTRRKKVIILTDYKGKDGGLAKDAKIFSKNLKNIFIFYYISYECNLSLRKIAEEKFNEWKPQQDIRQKKYSGRIMVQLNNQTRMAFELNSSMESESKVAFKLFLRSNQNADHKAIIPQLVDFFTKQKVSYILLIDYELLLQNDAFEEKKILEVMQERMMQAKNYEKSAVIIHLDSMVMLNQNVSLSNLGRSVSYSMQNHNIYQILKNYMLGFAMVSEKVSRWMTVIIEHPQLVSMVKRDLKWPAYPQQIEKQQQQQAKDVEKQCVRCNAIYTQRDNEKRQCTQHPGLLIDTALKVFNRSPVEVIKASIHKMKKLKSEDRANEEDRFLYACCQRGLNDQGCQSFYHIQKEDLNSAKDDHYHKRINQNERWQKVKAYFCEQKK